MARGRPLAHRRWRSLLFVPANNPNLMAKAPRQGADALIIDLEDAVPLAQKPAARIALQKHAAGISATGADILVRVNNGNLTAPDVDALPRETGGVVLPGTESVDELRTLDALLVKYEQAYDLRSGSIGIVPLIESPAALFSLHEIAAGPRVVGLALGSEDFALALGAPPSALSLTLPAQLVCVAAASAGVMAFAVPFSIAAYGDEIGWADAARTAKGIGATGGLCIHPAQVRILNDVFLPTDAELGWAESVIEVWAQAQDAGRGIVTLDGRMIDRPVFERALAVVKMKPNAP
jgi:citrate lyase subunit beta / citryl-CoA lyase